MNDVFSLALPAAFRYNGSRQRGTIMAKEKKQKPINLEEITALTKELFHAHYAGDLER